MNQRNMLRLMYVFLLAFQQPALQTIATHQYPPPPLEEGEQEAGQEPAGAGRGPPRRDACGYRVRADGDGFAQRAVRGRRFLYEPNDRQIDRRLAWIRKEKKG